MASAPERDHPAGEPPDGDPETARPTPPAGPELGPRPYVRLMTAIGGFGLVAAAVAAALGLSSDPALPFLDSVPSLPKHPGLPSGFPSGFPSTLPTGYPTGLPTGYPTGLPTGGPELPTSVPSLPTDFPTLPDVPEFGGVS